MVQQIYEWVENKYEFYRVSNDWKSRIRHVLSAKHCFTQKHDDSPVWSIVDGARPKFHKRHISQQEQLRQITDGVDGKGGDPFVAEKFRLKQVYVQLVLNF
jgi:hypothetical protein